jgi:hypothetical protein
MYTAVYIHIVYICAYTCNLHLYTYIYIHILTWAGRKLTYDRVLTHILANEGGGGTIPLPVTVTSESVCTLRVAGSPTRRELADLTRKWHGPA